MERYEGTGLFKLGSAGFTTGLSGDGQIRGKHKTNSVH